MMNATTQLRAIDARTLTAPVRSALRSDTVEIDDWQSSPLGVGVGNPVSLGLHRFSGTAHDRGEPLTWSLVLKMAQSPANVGALDMGEGDDPTHWNYCKRELYLYQSDLLDHLPPGLAAPRCFGAEERPGDVIWLWLEEISAAQDGAPWPLERYGLAARHFGRFNGAYLAERPLPAYPWLSTGLLRHWCSSLATDTPLFPVSQARPNLWQHPLVCRIYPPPDANPFLQLLVDRNRFLAALDACPQTVCHRDAYPTDLMGRRRENGQEETVAVDWALAGIGPVGEELAQLTAGALDSADAAEAQDVDEVLFAGYVDGLRDSGWRGDAHAVRFGYVASAALRIGLWLLWLLNRAFEESGAIEHQDAPGEPIEGPALSLSRAEPRDLVAGLIEQQARATRFVLDLAEEAYELLDTRA
ncbi:MAG: hypothetical protein PVG25_14400 [Anaerolineae bacterium]|jgi:hypothetical protein